MSIDQRPLAHSTAHIAPRRAHPGTRSTVQGLALVLLLVLALTTGLLVGRWRPALRVDFAQPPVESGMDLIGLHLLERNAAFAYRWTSDYAFAQVPHGYNAAHAYIATVRIQAPNPRGPQPLTFLSNERPLATVMPQPAFRTYRLLLPPAPPGQALRFALQTTPFSQPNDPRLLGVIMTGIALQPLPWFDWSATLLVPAGLLALWLWLRTLGEPARGALLICAGMGLALLAFGALYRPAPLRYPLLALLTLLGAAAGVQGAGETASRLGLALLAALMSFSGVLWASWITDDAIISFRYAQNLVAGHGLVFNPGERVEGYTNFLWTILAALLIQLGGDPVWWSYLAGIIIGLAILLLTYRLARRLLGPPWALAAALLVATSQSLLVYTTRGAGLETGFFTLLLLAGSTLVISAPAQRPAPARWLAVGITFALATMTRPEGALVFALTLLAALLPVLDGARKARRSTFVLGRAPALAGYLLLVGPFFLWRLGYYGEWLPNTFYAKTGGGLRQVLRGLAYTANFALTLLAPLLVALLAPMLAFFRGRRYVPLGRRILAFVMSWHGYLLLLATVYTAYIIVVGGDHFPGERFFVPLVPWLALLIASGMRQVYTWTQQHPLAGRLVGPILGLLLVGHGLYALERNTVFDLVIRGDDESVGIWRELGWWLHDHAAPGESVAAMGIGAIAYYSDRTTIDMLGLADKHIARVEVEDMGAGTAGHEKRDPDYVLNVRRPTYIPRMWEDYFGGEAVLQSQYDLITIHTRYGRAIELWKRRA